MTLYNFLYILYLIYINYDIIFKKLCKLLSRLYLKDCYMIIPLYIIFQGNCTDRFYQKTNQRSNLVITHTNLTCISQQPSMRNQYKDVLNLHRLTCQKRCLALKPTPKAINLKSIHFSPLQVGRGLAYSCRTHMSVSI
jgi:hypothetical protein